MILQTCISKPSAASPHRQTEAHAGLPHAVTTWVFAHPCQPSWVFPFCGGEPESLINVRKDNFLQGVKVISMTSKEESQYSKNIRHQTPRADTGEKTRDPTHVPFLYQGRSVRNSSVFNGMASMEWLFPSIRLLKENSVVAFISQIFKDFPYSHD